MNRSLSFLWPIIVDSPEQKLDTGNNTDVSNLKFDEVFLSVGKAEPPRKASGTELPEFFPDRQERTATGLVIGVIRDLIDSPDSEKAKTERASTNDFLAEMAVDVAVMHPKFRSLKAGLARGALLADPHRGLNQDAMTLGLNVTEGAALNKLSRSMMPGSGLNKLNARYLGQGFKAEAATHLGVGFGFGTIKSGFDERTWLNDSGEVDLALGSERVLKTGATAAAFNLPAGIVGMRSAHLTSSLTGKLSPRTQSLMIGSTSGYTSGALMGVIDAHKNGKSWSETLAHANNMGLLGLGTGALMMGTMPLDKAGIQAYRRKPNELASVLESGTRKVTAIDANSELALIAQKRLLESTGKRIETTRVGDQPDVIPARRNPLDPLEFAKTDSPDLEALSLRLRDEGVQVRREHYLPESQKKTTFKTWEEFVGALETRDRTVRVYGVDGHDAKIVVNGADATRMRELKSLRTVAQRKVAYDNLGPNEKSDLYASMGEVIKVKLDDGSYRSIRKRVSDFPPKEALMKYMSESDAQLTLETLQARHKLRRDFSENTVLPEDMVAILDELPNPKLAKELIIDNEANVNDKYTSDTYEKGFQSAASAGRDGKITFYKPKIDVDNLGVDDVLFAVRDTGKHEWAHLANFDDNLTDGLYHLARRVDKVVPGNKTAPTLKEELVGKAVSDNPDTYFARTYARRNHSENWAVHMGEELMSVDAADFIALTENAPVRTVILAKNLAANMKGGTNGRALAERLRYVQDKVVPEAHKVLETRLKSNDPVEKQAAIELLGHLGDPDKHVDMLLKVANEPQSLKLKDGIHGLTDGQFKRIDPRGERTLANNAFDAAKNLATQGYHGEGELTFLVRNARYGEGMVQEYALRGLYGHRQGGDLPHFVRLAGNPDNLPELLQLMRAMPNDEAQGIVFNEIIALGEKGNHGSDFLQSVYMMTADKVPSQRMRAFELLGAEATKNPTPQMESFFRRHSIVASDKEAAKVNEILGAIRAKEQLGTAVKLLGDSSSTSRMKGLAMVKSMAPNNDLVIPLFRIVANGSATESAQAIGILREYPQNIVKYNAKWHERFGVELSKEQIKAITGA